MAGPGTPAFAINSRLKRSRRRDADQGTVKALRHVIAPTNWTGFYVGGFFGGAEYGSTDIRFRRHPQRWQQSAGAWAALGGAQIGYNYQFSNNWVFGVEADVGAANMRGARTCRTGHGQTPSSRSAIGFNCPEQDQLDGDRDRHASVTPRAERCST